MHQHVIRWICFFQGIIFTRFRRCQLQAIEVLTWLILGHLFGLYNPNQLADALGIAKSTLYSHLGSFSCYQWKRLLLEVSCKQATELIEETEAMSDATKSRRRITLSVDDTVQERSGRVLSYCYNWYSGRFHKTLKGQNILAVTIKIGDVVLPLNVRLVAKQGRANTSKPTILKEMMSEIVAFFSEHNLDITEYPISFDSWYGSQKLRETLEEIGFSSILIHAKSNYVFTIDGVKQKLSKHKKEITLKENQWGCDKAVARTTAESPTFGVLTLLFFADGSRIYCMMVFGPAKRAVEILRIWRQHHGIEQFWRNLKSIVGLSAMRMRGRDGAYASLGIKVLAYLLLVSLSMETKLTLQKIILALSGQREQLMEIIEHFHSATQQVF
jgi:hypothetical protein